MSNGVVIIISADVEWRAVLELYPQARPATTPFGQYFSVELKLKGRRETIVFFQGSWGKIAAAASAQYAIDRWTPNLCVNLGTCGGFEGQIERGVIILVERTIVYDIIEQILDPDEAIAHYSTEIDLTWLGEPYPQEVYRALLVSGDRDLVVEDIPGLKEKYGAFAGDWESGAIAWVAARNKTRCLILRGVTDLVGETGEAYDGNSGLFVENTRRIMEDLVRALPDWIAKSL